MNERTAVWLGAIAGAAVGGAFGYLYLSERGRELREGLEPRVADLIRELQKTWEAGATAREAVEDAWAAAPGADRGPARPRA